MLGPGGPWGLVAEPKWQPFVAPRPLTGLLFLSCSQAPAWSHGPPLPLGYLLARPRWTSVWYARDEPQGRRAFGGRGSQHPGYSQSLHLADCTPLPSQSPPERHGDHLPLPVPGLCLLLPRTEPLRRPDALPGLLPGPYGTHRGIPGETAGTHPLPSLYPGPAPLRLHGPADCLGGSPPPVTSRGRHLGRQTAGHEPPGLNLGNRWPFEIVTGPGAGFPGDWLST